MNGGQWHDSAALAAWRDVCTLPWSALVSCHCCVCNFTLSTHCQWSCDHWL